MRLQLTDILRHTAVVIDHHRSVFNVNQETVYKHGTYETQATNVNIQFIITKQLCGLVA